MTIPEPGRAICVIISTNSSSLEEIILSKSVSAFMMRTDILTLDLHI